jgi:hypothetical protein
MTRAEVYRALAAKYDWDAEKVANLTPYQQRVYLTDEGGPVQVASLEEAKALVRKLKNG